MPAIPRDAIPGLRHRLSITLARVALGPVCARTFGPDAEDLTRQIEAAKTGAATWTDTTGATWGEHGTLMSGPAPSAGWFAGAGF